MDAPFLPSRQDRPLAGVLWMLATGLSFVAVNAIVKHSGGRIPAAESAWLRFLAGLVFLLPALRSLLAARIDRGLMRLFALRGLAQTCGVILWFFAMTQIPMAEVTAINYLNPLGVTLGAALIFGEALPARRLLALAVAFVGALVVLRPGLRTVEPGHLAMLGAAGFFAASYLITGQLAARARPAVVVAMLSLTVTVFLAPIALAVWVPPTMAEVGWSFGVAAFATLGHYTMTRAFAVAPMSVTQAVTFLQLIWSVLLGAALFGESVDPWVILGGGLILGAVVTVTWRDAQARQRAGKAA